MRIYPASGWQKVGFDVVRQAVLDTVRSPVAEDIVSTWKPFSDVAEVQRELRLIAELHGVLASEERIPFEATSDVTPALQRAAPEGAMLGVEDLLEIQRLMRVSSQVRAWFASRASRCPHVREEVLTLVVPTDLADEIGRTIGDDGTISDGASSELRRLRRTLHQVRAQVRESAHRALREAIAAGWATEEQPTLRAGRMVIPVRAEAKRKVQGFVHDVSATGQTVYIEPASSLELNNEVRELELAEAREVERIRRALTDRVRVHRRPLLDAVGILGRLDFRLAKAQLAKRMDATLPRVESDGHIDVRNGSNAALMLHFQADGSGRRVVPFSVAVSDERSMIVISGPNAGGKSVAMKGIGLLAAMVAHGLLLPVETGSRFDFFPALMVDIGDEQSMEDDLSTFSSHLANLTHILAEADRHSLVLIDEAGTGTDPEAGGAIAQAVLEALVEKQARTVVTTHFGPLKVFAHNTPGVENASMLFDQAHLAPTYHFQVGLPGSSFASEIAERVGLPAAITARARELLGEGKLRADALIADLVEKTRRLEQELTTAERDRREAEVTRADLEKRLSTVREEADDIRQKALIDAEGIVKGANRTVERTIREIKESQAGRQQTDAARKHLEKVQDSISGRKKVTKQVRKKIPAGAIHVGDQVRVDGGTAVGEVIDLSEKLALVAVGSMQMRVVPDRLTKVGGKRKQEVRVVQPTGRPSVMDVSARLDIRGQRVDEASAQVLPFLDKALAAGLDRVEILHGKGTGALRELVAELLDATPYVVDRQEAPIEEGGAGITIVRLA